MYMCGAAFDFHYLEILVDNVWNLWIFKLWINEYMYKEIMWWKQYEIQWCVWALVGPRLVAERGLVWRCDGPAAAKTTERTRTRVFVLQDGCDLSSH